MFGVPLPDDVKRTGSMHARLVARLRLVTLRYLVTLTFAPLAQNGRPRAQEPRVTGAGAREGKDHGGVWYALKLSSARLKKPATCRLFQLQRITPDRQLIGVGYVRERTIAAVRAPAALLA